MSTAEPITRFARTPSSRAVRKSIAAAAHVQADRGAFEQQRRAHEADGGDDDRDDRDLADVDVADRDTAG